MAKKLLGTRNVPIINNKNNDIAHKETLSLKKLLKNNPHLSRDDEGIKAFTIIGCGPIKNKNI